MILLKYIIIVIDKTIYNIQYLGIDLFINNLYILYAIYIFYYGPN